MTLAARLIALAPYVHPSISVAPQWAALIADAKKPQQKDETP